MIPDNCPLKSELNIPVKCPCYNKNNCSIIKKDIKTLKDIQDLVFREYIKNGYVYRWNNVKESGISDLAELGLIVTEIAEAQEIIRCKRFFDKHDLGLECADIIIRTLNFMSRKRLDADKLILEKHKENMEREKLHDKFI